ncbi:MAG: hypothetical protein H6R27_898 [Proteobacteria bacterium]|nr:hypothetical protein [Pseudomonadota bacterium]
MVGACGRGAVVVGDRSPGRGVGGLLALLCSGRGPDGAGAGRAGRLAGAQAVRPRPGGRVRRAGTGAGRRLWRRARDRPGRQCAGDTAVLVRAVAGDADRHDAAAVGAGPVRPGLGGPGRRARPLLARAAVGRGPAWRRISAAGRACMAGRAGGRRVTGRDRAAGPPRERVRSGGAGGARLATRTCAAAGRPRPDGTRRRPRPRGGDPDLGSVAAVRHGTALAWRRDGGRRDAGAFPAIEGPSAHRHRGRESRRCGPCRRPRAGRRRIPAALDHREPPRDRRAVPRRPSLVVGWRRLRDHSPAPRRRLRRQRRIMRAPRPRRRLDPAAPGGSREAGRARPARAGPGRRCRPGSPSRQRHVLLAGLRPRGLAALGAGVVRLRQSLGISTPGGRRALGCRGRRGRHHGRERGAVPEDRSRRPCRAAGSVAPRRAALVASRWVPP